MLLGFNFVMHKKIARLWRYLRTPVLLTSAAILVIGCASRNPLIDEADPTETTEPVSARRTIEPAQKEDPVRQDLTGTPVPERKMTEQAPQKENAEPENELNSKPTGLKKWLTKLSPYKINIQQGNFISSEMLAKIQPGMTKEQVRFILGTPLLTDMFHAGRWDYLFRLQKPNGATTTNRVTIFFSDNLVDHIVSDNLPREAEYLSHITSDDEPSEKTGKGKETDSEKSAIEKPAEQETAEQQTVMDTSSGSTTEPEPVTTTEPDSDTAPDIQPAAATSQEPVRATETPHIPASVGTSEPVRETATVHPSETTGGLKPSSSRVRIPKPVSTPETAKTPESVRATEPTRSDRASRPVSTPLPIRAPEPASATEPVSAPVPAMETDTEKRPVRRTPVRQTMAVDTDDVDENVSSGNIGTFEPISTPSRIGKMLPVSPNDELIGNIQ